MINLQNSARILSVYVGNYANEALDSDFNADSIIKIGYSDFMAWLYQNCNTCITFNENTLEEVVNFTITSNQLNKCINNCFDTVGKKLEFKTYSI